MQLLRWTRTGREYTHADEGLPNQRTWTSAVGETNVDVHGDGTAFAPYVLDGTRLRHGDSECEFADGWQTIRRLGQTLVRQSRLYVQRQQGQNWNEVSHGIPTRNVVNDYPREGKCTAYLDFPNIQGYAQGARLQIGIEVGGGDRQVFGFRFRSPQAGTFRLEWVLEVPDGVDLSWITEPTSRTDSTPIRVGGRIGSCELHWTRAEAPFRSATVTDNAAGGKDLHLILGPYTVAAQEWLTIYPDWGPTGIAADADDHNVDIAGSEYYYGSGSTGGIGYTGKGRWDGTYYEYAGGMRWQNVAVAKDSTITTATVTVRGTSTSGTITSIHMKLRGDDVDDAAAWASNNNAADITATTAGVDWDPTSWSTSGNNDLPDIATIIAEITSRANWASGNDLRIAWRDDGCANPANNAEHAVFWAEWAHATYAAPTLTIAYTEAGGGTLSVKQPFSRPFSGAFRGF